MKKQFYPEITLTPMTSRMHDNLLKVLFILVIFVALMLQSLFAGARSPRKPAPHGTSSIVYFEDRGK